MQRSSLRRTPRRRAWWIGLFLIALALRAGWGTLQLVNAEKPTALEFPDEQQYWLMATSLHAGDGLRDELGFRATRMPLYPGLLSLFAGSTHGIVAAKVFHWLIGALAAVVTAALATTLFDRRVGALAGLLVAFDPFLIFFSSLLLTETLFIAGVTLFYWIVAPMIDRTASTSNGRHNPGAPSGWGRWIAAGLAGAFCVYARESTLGLIALVSCILLIWRRFDRRAMLGTAISWTIVLVALIPWAIRNHAVIGEWCWLTTRGGISLYDGVGPQATGASDLGQIKQMPAVEGLSETQWNRYFMSQSLEAIKADPARVVRLAGIKLSRMWNPFPNAEGYRSGPARAISPAWMLPISGLAVLGLVLLPVTYGRLGARIAFFLLLPALYLSGVHSLFVGSVRYRLGAMPMLEILAAFAVVKLFDRVRRRDCEGDRGSGATEVANDPSPT